MKTNKELLDEIYSHFPEAENPDESMSMLITDCVETGITYWNTKWPKTSTPQDEDHFYGDCLWEDLKNGKSFTFGDGEDTGVLSLESIAKSLTHMKKSSPGVYQDIQDENWDACVCDEFFQTAIFGEMVFG